MTRSLPIRGVDGVQSAHEVVTGAADLFLPDLLDLVTINKEEPRGYAAEMSRT